jgi:PRTRC genetic system protein F
LDLGILRETDWCGTLAESFLSGLGRWFDREMGGAQWRHLRLSLLFTDDADGTDDTLDDEVAALVAPLCSWGWRSCYHYPKEAQVGWFALTCGQTWDCESHEAQEVCVGERITALNALYPGAGYSVLGLLASALGTVNGVTPEWGLRWVKWNGGFSGRDDDDPEIDALAWERPDSAEKAQRHEERCLSRYRRGLPRGVWTAKWRAAPVRRALRRCGLGTAEEELAEILQGALDLAGLDPRVRKLNGLNELGAFMGHGEELVAPVLVRWNRDDLLTRAYDDYIHSSMETSGYTLTTFARGFAAEAPESIRKCLDGLTLAVETVSRCDRLLDLLHTPARERVRVQAWPSSTSPAAAVPCSSPARSCCMRTRGRPPSRP